MRSQHRQAAPFSRRLKATGEPRTNPTQAGRAEGHAGHYREQPSQAVNEAVEVPLDNCPQCAGALQARRALDQIIEELPPVRLRVVALRTWEGYCQCCQQVVRSTHPLQVSTARGAARIHLGPRLLHLLVDLSHRGGLTNRKVVQFLRHWLGVRLSPGAVSQAFQRLAGKLQQEYEELKNRLQQAALAHVDETGWYVHGRAWLWVFCTPGQTLYQVRARRRRAVVEQVLGPSFAGTLVSDCLNVYEALPYPQQKCYAHHLRYLHECLEAKPRSRILPQLMEMLRQAMSLKKLKRSLPADRYEQHCQDLEKQADKLLATRISSSGARVVVHPPQGKYGALERSAILRLAKRRQHLFTFLYDEQVPPTNNLAERQLRPAVIQRKLSCGNRTWAGAQAWQVLRSLLVTHSQQQQDLGQTIRNALQRAL